MKLYYSEIPLEKRLFVLVQFVRTHLKEKIVILCYGKRTVEFLARYFTELEILTCKITGAMEQRQRDNSIKLFKANTNVLLISQEIAQNVDFGKPTWLVEYSVPPELSQFIKLVNNIEAEKTLLFLDPQNEAAFAERVQEQKMDFKLLPFDVHKVPDLKPKLLRLLDKTYEFYLSSQEGYREMIRAYVNSENPEFDALKLRLTDASISFGIEHPPKLPLTK